MPPLDLSSFAFQIDDPSDPSFRRNESTPLVIVEEALSSNHTENRRWTHEQYLAMLVLMRFFNFGRRRKGRDSEKLMNAYFQNEAVPFRAATIASKFSHFMTNPSISPVLRSIWQKVFWDDFSQPSQEVQRIIKHFHALARTLGIHIRPKSREDMGLHRTDEVRPTTFSHPSDNSHPPQIQIHHFGSRTGTITYPNAPPTNLNTAQAPNIRVLYASEVLTDSASEIPILFKEEQALASYSQRRK
jgi:hypothetical protein